MESVRNTQLQLYLDRYALSTRDVAVEASVPLVTMWRAMQGLPITTAHAAAIRRALWRLTGEFYAGPVETSADTGIDLPASREQRQRGER